MSANRQQQTRFFKISVGAKLIECDSLEDALKAYQEGYCIWLDFTNPEQQTLNQLIEPLGLHPLSIEDCLDEDQIPKMEEYPSNTFILFNRYLHRNSQLTIHEVDFFLGKKFLVSVNIQNGEDTQHFAGLLDNIKIDSANALRGPDYLLHVILDYIVDEKFVAIESMQEELDAAEETVLNSPGQFSPGVLMELRRHLLALRKSLFHEREILVKICRRDSPFITEKAIFNYRDIYDHLARFFELAEIYRDMISGLMEMYLSMLNNQMSLAANKTNQVVSRLTMITTIFMPLTLIAGIGGMSEWSMMTGPENWRVSYPLFMLAMLLLGLITYFALKAIEKKS